MRGIRWAKPCSFVIPSNKGSLKMVCALWLNWDAALTMRLVPTGHLLFFASPKKSEQKKGDCGCRFASQTSLVSHDFSGGQKTRRFAAQTVLSFFPEKSRSTRLRQQQGCIVVKIGGGINRFCFSLVCFQVALSVWGSLKTDVTGLNFVDEWSLLFQAA